MYTDGGPDHNNTFLSAVVPVVLVLAIAGLQMQCLLHSVFSRLKPISSMLTKTRCKNCTLC